MTAHRPAGQLVFMPEDTEPLQGLAQANAAWLRLALLAHNVLTAFTRLALPPALLTARPKRLRFLLFTVPGRLVTHARQLWLRLACLCGTRRQATTHARRAQVDRGRPPPARPDVSALPQGPSSTRSARRRGRVCPARPVPRP